MLMKDKKTGEIVGMRYGAAMDAQAAGTHEVVNEPADPANPPPGPETLAAPVGADGSAEPGVDLATLDKAGLIEEAERRGVSVPSGATKAEIVALLNG
jgi:hypothetical protein